MNMLSALLAILSITSPEINLYIAPDVSENKLLGLITDGHKINAYAENYAICLIKPGEQIPPGAQLIASNLVPERLAMVWLLGRQNLILPAMEYPNQWQILFRSESFWIVSADDIGKDILRRAETEVTPLRLRSISAPRSSVIPEQPLNLPIIHDTINNIHPDELSSIDETLSDFISRFTFDERLVDSQTWAVEQLLPWGVTTSEYRYNSLGDTIHYYGMREDFELDSYFGFIFKKIAGVWQTYHAPIVILDTKYNNDFSHLYLSGRGGLVAWNTNPNSYSDWTVKDTGCGKDLYGIYVEGSKIWAVGKEGTITYSSNNGDSWQILPSGTNYHTLEEVGKFHVGSASDQKYFIIGGGSIVLRSDDGVNWTQLTNIPVTDIWLRDIIGFESPIPTMHGEILICGAEDVVISSPDGGQTWSQGTGATGYWMHAGYHAGRCWVVGTMGNVAKSDNYGLNWTLGSPLSDFAVITNLSFPSGTNPDQAYSCGQYNIHKYTNNGGIVWQALPDPVSNYQSFNVIGELTGDKYPDEIVIVCAHQDSTSDNPYLAAPGADDNGSGSAAVLAIAEQMAEFRFARTVRFILFSGEEQGLLGSYAYADAAAAEGQNIVAVLNMDMIGYRDNDLFDFDIRVNGIGTELQDFISQCAQIYTPQLIINETSGGQGGSDHAPFSENGYQAVLLIEHPGAQWYPFYHTQQDLPAQLDFSLVSRGTRLICSSAMELAGVIERRDNGEQDAPYAYPVPLRMDRGRETITFTNLELGAKVAVYDLSGERLCELTSSGINLTWDPQLASGVYIYVIKSGGEQYSGKIAIIK